MLKQKQGQKRYVNPFVQFGSGGIRLRGLDPKGAWNPNIFPTIEAVVDAGGNSVDVTLLSDNEDQFDFVRVSISDTFGNSEGAPISSSPVTIDTTSISKQYSSTRPGIIIQVVWRLKNGNTLEEQIAVLDYSIPLDTGTFAAGITVDSSNRLDANDRGQYIALDVVYSTGPDQIDATITSIASIGLAVELFEDGVSIGTGTISETGAVIIADSGTRAPGTYVYKVVITSEGAAKDSFALYTLTVA